MSNLVTAALTALFGVIVFVAGQFLQKFILEPIQEQRKIIAEIAFAHLFFANVIENTDSPDAVDKASEKLRTLAYRLLATLWTIPFYGVFARLGWVYKREVILEASQALAGWSNEVGKGRNSERRIEIAKALNFQIEADPKAQT